VAYPIPKDEIEQFMSEGTKAFLSGLKPSEGPYSKFSYQGRLWLKGYSNAKFGDSNMKTTLQNGAA